MYKGANKDKFFEPFWDILDQINIDNIDNFWLMKYKTYIVPSVSEQTIQYNGFLCASGDPDRVSSNTAVHGGDKSGDVKSAF